MEQGELILIKHDDKLDVGICIAERENNNVIYDGYVLTNNLFKKKFEYKGIQECELLNNIMDCDVDTVEWFYDRLIENCNDSLYTQKINELYVQKLRGKIELLEWEIKNTNNNIINYINVNNIDFKDILNVQISRQIAIKQKSKAVKKFKMKLKHEYDDVIQSNLNNKNRCKSSIKKYKEHKAITINFVEGMNKGVINLLGL